MLIPVFKLEKILRNGIIVDYPYFFSECFG